MNLLTIDERQGKAPAPTAEELKRRQLATTVSLIRHRVIAQLRNVERYKSFRPTAFDLARGKAPDGLIPIDWTALDDARRMRDELRAQSLDADLQSDFEFVSAELDYVLQEVEPLRPKSAATPKTDKLLKTTRRGGTRKR